MALHAQFGVFQRDGGFIAILGEQAEAELGIEDGVGQGLKRQQADGLILQLFDAGRAVLAGWGEDLDDGRAHGVVGVQAAEEERQGDGGGVSDDVYRSVDGRFFRRVFDQGSAEPGFGALFGGAGEVDDGGAGGAVEEFESFAARLRGAGEEDGARVDQAGGIERADDGGLIANARERAGLFAGIGHQAEIESSGGSSDYVADFAAEQGIGTDEGDGVHEERRRRRMMPPRRMKMPLATYAAAMETSTGWGQFQMAKMAAPSTMMRSVVWGFVRPRPLKL